MQNQDIMSALFTQVVDRIVKRCQMTCSNRELSQMDAAMINTHVDQTSPNDLALSAALFYAEVQALTNANSDFKAKKTRLGFVKKFIKRFSKPFMENKARIALGVAIAQLIASCQASQPQPESPTVQPLITLVVEVSATVAATETSTNTPTQTATPTEVVQTQASQEEIEELAKNLYCPDIGGCIVQTIDGTRIDAVATGYLKEIRLKKPDRTEYGTVITAQVITRAKTKDPNIMIPRSFWITIQAELDNDKSINQDFTAIFFIKLRCIKIGINTPEMKRAENLDFYKELIQKGQPLSVTFKRDGKPSSGVYQDSQFSDPSLTKSIHNFLQSDGVTQIDPDSVLTPYTSSDTKFTLDCGAK